MRLNKLSELIHKSSKYQDETATVRVSFCEIWDHEEDPDYFEVISGSEFTVSRQVNRASTSKYFISEKQVDFKQVVDLLKSKGIDLDHNRFLILQGEVESISLMKPKGANENETGLLEYLEDIIGSNQYVQVLQDLQ